MQRRKAPITRLRTPSGAVANRTPPASASGAAPEIEFAPVEPHPAPVPDELSDGEDRDRLPDAERRRERREQHGSPAEPRHGGERAGEERGPAENQPLADLVHLCET